MSGQLSKHVTFAASQRGDFSGFGSDVIDNGILEPWDPKTQMSSNKTRGHNSVNTEIYTVL